MTPLEHLTTHVRLECECGALWVERPDHDSAACPSCPCELDWYCIEAGDSDMCIVGEGPIDLTASELDAILTDNGFAGDIARGDYAHDEGHWCVERGRPLQTTLRLTVRAELFKGEQALRSVSVAFFVNGDLASLRHILDRADLVAALNCYLPHLRTQLP